MWSASQAERGLGGGDLTYKEEQLLSAINDGWTSLHEWCANQVSYSRNGDTETVLPHRSTHGILKEDTRTVNTCADRGVTAHTEHIC